MKFLHKFRFFYFNLIGFSSFFRDLFNSLRNHFRCFAKYFLCDLYNSLLIKNHDSLRAHVKFWGFSFERLGIELFKLLLEFNHSWVRWLFKRVIELFNWISIFYEHHRLFFLKKFLDFRYYFFFNNFSFLFILQFFVNLAENLTHQEKMRVALRFHIFQKLDKCFIIYLFCLLFFLLLQM